MQTRMTQFADLPDDCYYPIFALLPTSTLLSCRRVCRTWLRHQQVACHNRRSLILLQGYSPAKLFAKTHFEGAFFSHRIDQNGQPMDFDRFLMQNKVNIRSFDTNVTQFLAETFPKLDTLIIVHRQICSQGAIEPLIDLLKLYSSQVVTLKMYFDYQYESAKYVIYPNILEVIHQLDSMTALEHVTLELYNTPGHSFNVSSKDLEFLSRIKEFYYYSRVLSPSWYDALRQLEQNDNVPQLKHIGIGHNEIWRENRPPDQLPLRNRFTHFPFNDYFHNVEISPRFAQSIANFSSLTSFTINLNEIDNGDTQLAIKLSTLSQHCHSLVHIKIFVQNYPLLFVQPFDPSTIKPLETVKALDLVFSQYHYFARIDLQTQVSAFVHTFPSLISIKMITSNGMPNRYDECVNFFAQLKTAFGRESIRTVYRQEKRVKISTN